MVNTSMWYHPKYYKELRKRNKLAESRQPVVGGQQQSDQAISEQASTEVSSVRPGPGLKPQATEASSLKPERQALSIKPKRQANEELEGLKRYVKNTKSPI